MSVRSGQVGFRWGLIFLGLHHKALHEFCGVITRQIIWVVHQLPVERNSCLDALNHKLIQSALHLENRLFSGLGSSDQFSDHRVVIGRNHITAVDVGIQSNSVSPWVCRVVIFPGLGLKSL